MKKHIIFGGFDYAILYEMDQNAILTGIDYFIDIDEERIGTTYLGKTIKDLSALEEENVQEILILIGSIVYRTELELRLKALGYKERVNYMWAIAFNGDEQCPRLWSHIEWSDVNTNKTNLKMVEEGEYSLQRLKVAVSMVDWEKTDTIIDFGAANERLRGLITDRIKYYPVDNMRYSNETILCDLNKQEFPVFTVDEKKTCVFLIGILQYVENWQCFLQKVGEIGDVLLIEHMDFARINREYRRAHLTGYNVLFDHEIIRQMLKIGFELVDSADFRLKSTIYKFVRRRN